MPAQSGLRPQVSSNSAGLDSNGSRGHLTPRFVEHPGITAFALKPYTPYKSIGSRKKNLR